MENMHTDFVLLKGVDGPHSMVDNDFNIPTCQFFLFYFPWKSMLNLEALCVKKVISMLIHSLRLILIDRFLMHIKGFEALIVFKQDDLSLCLSATKH